MVHIHGGNPQKILDTKIINQENIIDFSVNTNFFGPPQKVFSLLENNLYRIENYPEENSMTLKNKLSKKININKDNIIIGNGATEIIYKVVKNIFPEKILITAPTFSEYQFAAESIGAEVKHYLLKEDDDFNIDLSQIIKRIEKDNFDIVFICNPNNPTGKLINKKKIEIILKKAKEKNTLVIVDESFIDFVEEKYNYTVIDLIDKYNNLFIIRSFTKIFSIPGIRLGYGIGCEKIINNIEESRDPWSVNIFAQLIGEKLLNERQYIDKYIKEIAREKDILYNFLLQLKNIDPIASNVNFILLNISNTNKTSSQITKILAHEGLIVRNCNSFKVLKENYIRIAVRRRKDNMILLKALTEL